MPENLYPKLQNAPSTSQESFKIEMVRKYYPDITDLKNKYDEKQRKYKNSYDKLLNTSTAASFLGVISGISTIGTKVRYLYEPGELEEQQYGGERRKKFIDPIWSLDVYKIKDRYIKSINQHCII